MPLVWIWQWSELCSYAVHDDSSEQRVRHCVSDSPGYLVWVEGAEVSGSSQLELALPACPATPPQEMRQQPFGPFVTVGAKKYAGGTEGGGADEDLT